MILYDSSYEDIYRQMTEEREKTKYYNSKYEDFARREWRHRRPPCLYYKVQQMPGSLNKYLYYYYALQEAELRDNCCFFGNMLLVNSKDGKQYAIRLMTVTELIGENIVEKVDSMHIFTGHFFSRYRERFSEMKDLPPTDLIATFAGRNMGYLQQLDYKNIVLKKDIVPNGSAWAIDDGFILGETEWINVDGKKVMVCNHKTFLGRHTLKENQEKHTLPKSVMRDLLLHHFK